MASRLLRACLRGEHIRRGRRVLTGAPGLAAALCAIFAPLATPQLLLKPSEGDEKVHLLPSDVAILESRDARKDIPCTVTQRKPELGFDLRFHSGYDLTVPLRELAGDGEVLTVVFQVSVPDRPDQTRYFAQHIRVPAIEEDAKGDAVLDGTIDLGEGKYHVSWLMRDRAERICSSSWDVEATLPPKDKIIPLFIGPNEAQESVAEPFVNDGKPASREGDGAKQSADGLNLKLLVNFAPQNSLSAALQRSDTDALVSILKTIQRDPHVARISLVAFNIAEGRVVYRQEMADGIDFPALGKALHEMKLGTITVSHLSQPHSDTDFLEDLIEKEVGTTGHPDGVIFAGPKAMLDADVPQNDLRRIGDIECPVFYMNYNLNPQATPWKDSISHAIRAFKGTEYTISRPRDLWVSTTEVMDRILRSKRQRAMASAATGGLQ